MAKSQLFEYAVLYHPKEKKDAAGNVMEKKKSIVIVEVTRILAESQQTAGLMAARSIPEEYVKGDLLEDCEIIVRPF